ncbi:ceramidase domain-containing protein [Methylobacterium sp. WL6]|uniref:ceramidase domain-containing protein n=1 Tax=Methylobacterium sp. WL6 TaxID=2603901 RepID=UPI0011C9E540|nr:ceramidase domain-containing protein [Methylobacterium sp. WL6]TXN72053.1 ceramidase [Methylobacterium sp. WL6]
MDWFEPIAGYCERGSPAFWAEPVNAVSNAAFLVAGTVAFRRARTVDDRPAAALALLTAIVGVGSFLFHTLAVRWAMLADVVPIAVFIHAYFFLAMVRFLRFGLVAAAAATLAFAGFGFGLVPALDAAAGRSVETLTNGSVDYLPAVLALLGVALGLRWLGDPSPTGERLVALALLFGVSLALRTMDRSVCARVPVGTHFLWHLLNAGILCGLVVAAVRHRAASRRR